MGSDVTVLVGDVGGSNTRLALAGSDIGVTALKSFDNDSFTSLEEVLSAYCGQSGIPKIQGACIAVAGPVSDNSFRITNRNWHSSASTLADCLGLQPGARVDLINDLAALGHALPVLTSSQLSELCTGQPQGDQSLVVGIGTGFNVALVAGGRTAKAEMGHASLPAPVWDRLGQIIARAPEEFTSVEHVFSGHGLVRFHHAMTGRTAVSAKQILTDYLQKPEGSMQQILLTWAELLGLLARELIFMYMPGRGLLFAGGVARGVLGTPARDAFLQAFAQQSGALKGQLGEAPMSLITDDAAGVSGSARVALAAAGGDLNQ